MRTPKVSLNIPIQPVRRIDREDSPAIPAKPNVEPRSTVRAPGSEFIGGLMALNRSRPSVPAARRVFASVLATKLQTNRCSDEEDEDRADEALVAMCHYKPGSPARQPV
jgi:hypothetical protein